MIVASGQRFGRLVTKSVAGRSNDGHKLWLCACDCGNECTRQSNVLKKIGLVSCGCAARDVQVEHGMHGTPEYSSWRAAKQRCHVETDKDFPRYGGRGIEMCAAWRNSFSAFLEHLGNRPEGTTLERIRTDGNYEPGNCKWATASEQARNRRRSVYVDWNGARTHLCDVGAELGITYGAAFQRLKRGKLK